MQLSTPAPTAAQLPPIVSDAMRRVADAERELDRVYPLFATKLDDREASPTGAQASRELKAFIADLKVAHGAAIQALRCWSLRKGSVEAAAAAYESLATLIEQFARRASLDSTELD